MRIATMQSADTGGQSYKIAKAINTYTEHEARSFIKIKDYINFPHDILFGEHDYEFVREYLLTTDIIHVHNKYRNLNGWGKLNPKARYVIHQHGRFPEGHLPQEFKDADRQRGALRVVSTLNLLNYVEFDFNRWIPAPFDVDNLLKLKSTHNTENVLIAHSPTRRDYKNTDLLIETVNRIQGLELVLIEGKTNEESLRLKAMCDITFDQMHLCYGNSGLEAMCFKQAVIAAPTDSARILINKYIDYEPYVYATPDTLYNVLLKLTNDKEYRDKCANVSFNYVKKYHDFPVVANKLINIYKSIL